MSCVDILTLGQKRVLQVLGAAHGPLSRPKLAERLGSSAVYIGKIVGKSDPAKREIFETSKEGATPDKPKPSLLTLGYVIEKTLDIDGLLETTISLTPLGREAVAELEGVELPPLREQEYSSD